MTTKHPLYDTWQNMRRRCHYIFHPDYANYGGRGIKVCDEWYHSFENFVRDMGERPENHTLERRNNDGNYCKENCYWASWYVQANNRNYTKKNKDGVVGVKWNKAHSAYIAEGSFKGVRTRLYHGLDFLEACCARKSWENTRA